jgi:Leucine-rich repeat (LRR) protein
MNLVIIILSICVVFFQAPTTGASYIKCQVGISGLSCQCEEKPSCSRESVAIIKFCSLFDNTKNESEKLYCDYSAKKDELVLDNMCNETRVVCSKVRLNDAIFPQFSKNNHSKNFYLIAITKKNYKKVPDFSFQALKIEYLYLQNNRIELVESRAFYNVPGLRYLDLSVNEIANIELNYLAELEVLDLKGNKIAKVNDSMFMNLTRLKYLNLHYNSIEEIEKNAFGRNSDLRFLDLSSNKLKSLSFDLNLSKLVSFNLNENEIGSLSNRVFSNLISLKIFKFEKNELVKLGPNELDSLKQLRLLSLDNNILETVDLDGMAFVLTSLKTLSLSQNNFKTIDLFNSSDGICASENKLEVLDLNSNKIVEINRFTFSCFGTLTLLDLSNQIMNNLSSSEIFYGLRNLERLELNNNSIVRIYSNTFQYLGMLSYLDLSSNELLYLDSDAFRGLENLTTLVLTDNYLNKLTSNLFKGSLFKISIFELCDCKLTKIEPNSFLELQNSLKTMQLFSNRLQFLKSYFFSGLRELTFLNLKDNQISSIEKETFKDLVKLDKLNLADNAIAHIDPSIFIMLKELRVLDLSYNVLVELKPQSFRFLTQLKKLFLEHNQLVKINFNKVFAQENIQLEIVNLEFNSINKMDLNWFTCMNNLTDLNLNNNNFSMRIVEKNTSRASVLPNLKYLKLRNASLKLINLFDLSNLSEIDLSNSELDECTIQSIPFEKIQTLKLEKINGVSFNFSIWKNFSENLVHLDLSHNIINIQLLVKITTMESSEVQILVLANTSLNSTAFASIDVSLFPKLSFLDVSCNNISTVLNVSFTELTTLNLSHNSITNLVPKMFSATQKLAVLDMSYNLIDFIDEGSLYKIKALTYLDLSHNRLKILNQIMFLDNHLYKVANIFLNDNFIYKCEVFFDNPKIGFINLAGNNLTEVPNVIINDVELIDGLDFSRNSLTVIRNSYFKTTNSMYKLFLNINLIKTIEESAFSNMKLLFLLDLSFNQLSNLSVITFNGLYNLRLLNLSNNNIEFLQNGLFYQLYYLKTLDLGNNSIRFVEEDCFRQNRFLSEMFFYFNPLKKFFQNNTLKGLVSLQYLQVPSTVELNYETLQTIKNTARREFVKQNLNISYYDSTDIETVDLYTSDAEVLSYTENQCFQIIFLSRNLVSLNLGDSVYLNKFVSDCMCFVANAFVENRISTVFQF